jgi:hypothetical protein
MDFSWKTAGTIPRLIEFDDIVWTQSSKHSKLIKRHVMSDFGHLGKDFVSRYTAMDRSEITELYDMCEEEIEDGVTDSDQYSSRIIAKLAIIYMTAKLYARFFPEIDINPEEIRDYLITFESGKVPVRSIEAQAMEIIKEFIVINQNKLAVKQLNGQFPQLTSNGDFIGYRNFTGQIVGEKEEKVEVTIMARIIKEELYRHNIYQWRNILAYLRDNRFAKVFGNNKVTEKDNRLSVRAITFTFTRDTETDLMRWYGRSRYEALGIPTHTHDFNDDKGIDEIFGE